MSNSEGDELDFTYNELGKPVRIEFKGKGSIDISYDEYGEIKEVTSDEGHSIALEVTQAFQQMLGIINSFNSASSIQQGQLPDLGFTDPKLDEIRLSYEEDEYDYYNGENTKTASKWIESGLELAGYLIENTQSDPGHGPEACNILYDLYRYQKTNTDKKNWENSLQTIDLFHTALLKIRKMGVALDYWNQWIDMQDWLQIQKQAQKSLNDYRAAIENLQDRFADEPVVLLSSTNWLPKSFLQNPGYWKEYNLSEILPDDVRSGAVLNDIHYRYDGQLILGTSKGMSVLRKGYWEFMGYNPVKQAFTSEYSAARLDGSSSIYSMAEDDAGNLWLGTAKGVMVLGENPDSKVRKKYTDIDGLPDNIITEIFYTPYGMLIGTNKGMSIINEAPVAIEELNGKSIRFIRFSDYFQSTLYIGAGDGIYRLELLDDGYQIQLVFNGLKDDLIITPYDETMVLRGTDVSKLVVNPDNPALFDEIPIYGNVITGETQETFGMSLIPISDYEYAIGVLTDYGISFYHDNHFEDFNIPGRPGLLVKGITRRRSYDNSEKVGFALYNN
ncbi:MAG: hypothetical protein KAT15_24600, partial [Bacteroidales bacterium]|nr:hypothetical protein [Bacteroidales bacterium]